MTKIAYLGPEGTYSEHAAKLWNHESELIPSDSINMVSKTVENGLADQGIIPIENSIEGGVTFTLDLMIHESELLICGEIVIPINHFLMAKEKIELSEIKAVYSHPQSLGQCREFLKKHLPNAELLASLSNSTAVKEMLESNYSAAAISSQRAANLYDAFILKENIEDRPNNETRFIVISRKDHEKTGDDKTSLCFEFDGDRPGTLGFSLMEFASRNINLVKIESRPNKKDLGRYVFFVEIEGHRFDQNIMQAIDALSMNVSMLKILGSYPKHK
jgi:prephenate dehydratase